MEVLYFLLSKMWNSAHISCYSVQVMGILVLQDCVVQDITVLGVRILPHPLSTYAGKAISARRVVLSPLAAPMALSSWVMEPVNVTSVHLDTSVTPMEVSMLSFLKIG